MYRTNWGGGITAETRDQRLTRGQEAPMNSRDTEPAATWTVLAWTPGYGLRPLREADPDSNHTFVQGGDNEPIAFRPLLASRAWPVGTRLQANRVLVLERIA